MMTTSASPVLVRLRRCAGFLRTGLALPLLLSAVGTLAGAAPQPWLPITEEEKAAKASPLEPDAAAEVLFQRWDVDDRGFPQLQTRRDYVRYKIYDPERATDVTRISLVTTYGIFSDDKVEVHARLISPDGAIKEFGKADIKERPLSRTAVESTWSSRLFGGDSYGAKEKFLAVKGIVPGSILEFQTEEKHFYVLPVTSFVLQRPRIPVRLVEFSLQPGKDHNYAHDPFIFNTSNAEFKQDPKTKRITVTGKNLPSLLDEPFSGSRMDYALTLMSCYTRLRMAMLTAKTNWSVTFDDKAGKWVPFATIMFMVQQELGNPSKRVKAAAIEAIKGAETDLQKARQIHNYVQKQHLAFLKKPVDKERVVFTTSDTVIDDLLHEGRERSSFARSQHFYWLALGMYRAAGLQPTSILLPDRSSRRFNPKLVAGAFLSEECIGLKIDGKWVWSYPNAPYVLPFGGLPWRYEGQVGLVAQEKKEEFIPIPHLPAAQSAVNNIGIFKLNADGALTGEFLHRLSGHPAAVVRQRVRSLSDEKRDEFYRRMLEDELKGADLKVTKVAGLDDPDASVDITYKVEVSGFATGTDDRLVFRPSVFRAHSTSPFSAKERRNLIRFPFPWSEIDRVMIIMPPGYALETKSAAPSYPTESLIYRLGISYDAPKRTLHLRREFVVDATDIPVSLYKDLKGWFDAVADSDRHDLVLVKQSEAAMPAAAAGPTGSTL